MRRASARDTTALAVGSAISGVLAYVFFSLVTRTLGSAAAAPVSVLWTYWSASAAVLTFPLQHWIARAVAADMGEGGVRRALPGVAGVVAAAAIAAGTVTWIVRQTLFHQPDAVFPILVGAVTLGSAFIGVVRGGLAARHRFPAVGVALVGENGVRCVLAIGLAVAGVRAAWPYGLALVAGPLVGMAWPTSFRFSGGGEHRVSEAPLAFLGGVAGGSLLGQVVLTGGPVAVALLGGSPSDVTALFAGLALFRAPYTLALGLVTQLTGRFTGLVTAGRNDVMRRITAMILGATAAAAVLAGAAGGLIGNTLLRLVFGADVGLGALVELVAVGNAIALGNLVVTLTLVARGQGRSVFRSWIVACIGAVIAVLAIDGSPLTRVVWGFVVAEAVSFVLMVVDELRAQGGGRAAVAEDVAVPLATA